MVPHEARPCAAPPGPAPAGGARDAAAIYALRSTFGHQDYRAGQAEVIDSILAGRPTVAVMPTGSGKSLCYQLPAVLLPGVTLVVSPLIALIHEQVRALRARGVASASITSADPEDERRAALEALRRGSLKIAYLAPERFRSTALIALLRELGIALFVIDEAHCISQWGHDFRPDYARLGAVLVEVAPARVAALTATATPRVRADIAASLDLASPAVIVTGFDRPNLELSVVEAGRGAPKIAATAATLRRWMGAEGSGIVYTATRRRAEEVAAALAAAGVPASAYHAGLGGAARARVQQAFEAGRGAVIVATSAFGMGVDKPDVRAVVHHDLPRSPEAYYQEVGRAGRDGLPAAGVLLFDAADLRAAHLRLEAGCPSEEAVRGAFAALLELTDERGVVFGDLDEVADRLRGRAGIGARAALLALERSGSLIVEPGRLAVTGAAPRVDAALLQQRAREERAFLEAMTGYVVRARCRRRYLVDYFADPATPEPLIPGPLAPGPDRALAGEGCGVCDRCRGPRASPLAGEALRDAQIALSCVARMRGRYGRTRVADVLLGSRSRPVLEAGLDGLSTYGMLSSRTKEAVLALLDALTRADLARISGGEYPKLLLTEHGAEALRARTPIALDLAR